VVWGSWWSIPKLLEEENDIDLSAALTHPDNDINITPLASACLSTYPQTVKSLLQAGADPNQPGPWSPLWLAAVWHSHVEMLQSLLQYNADPNHKQLASPLLYALVTSQLADHQIILMPIRAF
jgi:ankyrin repeat protein